MAVQHLSDRREESSRRLLSPQQFSQLTGLSLATVHRYLKSGKLSYLQPGGPRSRILIPSDALGPPSQVTSTQSQATAMSVVPPPSAGSTQIEHLRGPLPRWIRKATYP
jgi:hypothetical protein